MVKVTKEEREYLESKGIKCSITGRPKHRHFYMTETERGMNLLAKYRRDQVIERVGVY